MKPSWSETLAKLPPTGWVSVILLCLLIVLAIHHRRGGDHWFAMTGCALLAVPTGYLAVRDLAMERELTAVARQMTGDETVWVHCASMFEGIFQLGRSGWAELHERPGVGARAHLTSEVCAHLRGFDPTSSIDLDEVVAVHVLVHEIIHLDGVANEAETDCIAVQRTAEAAAHLGASAEVGLELARRYLEQVYPSMPGAYRSPECRAQGRLDLTPDDGRFP